MFSAHIHDWSSLLEGTVPDTSNVKDAASLVPEFKDMRLVELNDNAMLGCFQKRGTLSLFALVKTSTLWPGATFLEQFASTRHLTKPGKVHLFIEHCGIFLDLPPEALFTDTALLDVLAIRQTCYARSSSDTLKDTSFKSYWSLHGTHIVFQLECSPTRKRLLDHELEPNELEALKRRLKRLALLCDTTLKTPLHIPRTIQDAFMWLEQRFLHPENYPGAPGSDIHKLYWHYGFKLLMGWLKAEHIHSLWRKIPDQSLEPLDTPDDSIPGYVINVMESKHMILIDTVVRNLSKDVWTNVRNAALNQMLPVRRGEEQSFYFNQGPKKALVVLYLLQNASPSQASYTWFKASGPLFHSSREPYYLSLAYDVLKSDPVIINYFLYTLARQLRLLGHDVCVKVTPNGLLALHHPDNLLGALKSDDRFCQALHKTLSVHDWPNNMLSDELLEVIEHRLFKQDPVAPALCYLHPNAYNILRKSAQHNPHSAFHLINMFPRVTDTDPRDIAHLTGLTNPMLNALGARGVQNIYTRIMIASPEIRLESRDFVIRILRHAVRKLPHKELSKLDTLLSELRDPELMQDLTAYRESLSALDRKKAVILREQEQAKESINQAGQLSLSYDPGDARGALSTFNAYEDTSDDTQDSV